jgi:hypothetical protein
MKWQGSLLTLTLLASAGLAEEPRQATPSTAAAPVPAARDMGTLLLEDPHPSLFSCTAPEGHQGGFLAGNRDFPNFIGWLSNPLQNIDPRSLTEFFPLFASYWTTAFPPLPSGNLQLYGAGLNLALTDRLSVGLNQGGYAASQYDKNRQGFLNLGGFVQYTVIADVADQFLLTGGLRWEAPTGEADVFQGHGPAHLAPYVTMGKEFGEFHVLATGGYQFPAREAKDGLDLFYLNVHFDRRLFGWLYPLVEFNWIEHRTGIDLSRPDRPGFFNFGTFESTGNLVAVAVGFDAMLVKERLELGAVYTTPIATQHNFDFNGLIVKMVLHY